MIVDVNFENPDVNIDVTEAFDVEFLAVPGPIGEPTDEQVLDAVEATLAEHPEWTTTVQNGAVTWNKLGNDVQSQLSDLSAEDENLQLQIDQLVAPTGQAPNPAEIINARIGANGITYTTLGEAIREQFKPLQDKTVQNLFNPQFYNQSLNGVTFAFDDSDNTYTVSGTATSNIYPAIGLVTLPAGTYKLLGCVGGSSSTYRLNLYKSNAVIAQDIGNGATFTLNEESELRLTFYINSGTVIDSLLKPMITSETWVALTDYVPYSGSSEFINGNLATTQYELFTSQLTGDKTNNDNVGWLYDIAKTWIDNASHIWYSFDGNLFKDQVIETDGKYPLTCSVFVNALIFGISYYDSKYNGKTANALGDYAYKDSTLMQLLNTTGIVSSGILQYFIKKGYAFIPEKNISNIKTGDILYVNFKNDGSYFYNADHSCVFAYHDPAYSYFYVWEVGGNAGPVLQRYSYTWAEEHIVFAVRPPYNSLRSNKRQIRLTANEFTAPIALSSLFDFNPNQQGNLWKVSLLSPTLVYGGDNSSIYYIRTNWAGVIQSKTAIFEGTGSGCRKLDNSFNVYTIDGNYTQPVTIIVEWLGW